MGRKPRVEFQGAINGNGANGNGALKGLVPDTNILISVKSWRK